MPFVNANEWKKREREWIRKKYGEKAAKWYDAITQKDSWVGRFFVIALVRFLFALVFQLKDVIKTLFGWAAMWAVRGVALASPGVALKLGQAISKVAYQPPPAWAGFIRSYIMQMTGQDIELEALMRRGTRAASPAVAAALGHEFLEPMLNLIMPSKEELMTNPYIGAERYLAVNLQFQMNAWLLHVIGDMFSLGMFKSLKDLPNAISWSYGLGWLSWLVMGTPFRVACSDPMEKDLNRRYLPTLPSASQLIDMYLSDFLSEDILDEYMRQLGYHPALTYYMVELAATKLSDTEMRRLYEEGIITDDDIEEYLRRKQYPRELRPYKKILLTKDRLLDLRNKLLDEVLDLYTRGAIPESTLREYYERQGYTRTETDIIVAIGDLRKQQRSQPTIAQIRSALKKNYITEVEARKMLIDRGYSSKWAEIILRL